MLFILLILVLAAVSACAFLLPFVLALVTILRQPKSAWQDVCSALYTGRVWHTRHLPVKHAFTYPLFIFSIDLNEVESGLFAQKLWPLSLIVNFRPSDHLKDHSKQINADDDNSKMPLQDRIHSFVALKTKKLVLTSRRTHRVLLVTHLSYYGYCFNPVSFYYVVGQETGNIEAIVAEVSNTPWNEMYNYVLNRDSVDMARVERLQDSTNFVFRKQFHVSPFMEMEYNYDWVFRDFESAKPSRIHVVTAMKQANDSNALQFSATMNVQRQSLHPLKIAWQVTTYPCYCMILQIWIHYQAFWLFVKGVTFQPHPTGSETTASRVIGTIMVPFFAAKEWVSSKKTKTS